MLHQKIKAVLFDWAGTTVDYGSRAPTQVFIEVFKRRGIQIAGSSRSDAACQEGAYFPCRQSGTRL